MSDHIVIVGASLSGCSTAVLLARAGHRVTILERQSSPDSFKRVCTHLIQNAAIPTLERLGLYEPMLRAGAKPSALKIWCRSTWNEISPRFCSDERGSTWNLNLRREVLDPMVRKLAAQTPGIELRLGASLESLIQEKGRVVGVVVTKDGKKETWPTKLVIGADGRHSATASLARIPVKEFQNIRGGWGAYYRNVTLGNGSDTHFWLLEPEIAYSFPTDDGLTLLATITTQDKLPVWKKDIESHHLQMLHRLPNGPDISRAERVSDFFGMLKAPGYYRDPNYRPGVTLVGDAALTTDFVWGDGCSFAFRSAEMLAESIGPAIEGDHRRQVDRAVKRYRKLHRRVLYFSHTQNIRFSKQKKVDLIRRIVFQSAQSNSRIRQLMFEVQTGRTDGLVGGLHLLLLSLIHQLGRPFLPPSSSH